jgi:hypothetical protein
MSTITQYGSIKMTGSHPNKIPDGDGDLDYEQDRIRDFAWLMDRVGSLFYDLIGGTAALIQGGIVTDDGSHSHVNITAGIGYAPFTVSVGNTAAVPPLTADEDITSERVSWGALSAQGTFSGTTTYYVKMAYAETDSLTRARAKATGTWAFTKTPSYTLTIDTSAPTAYQILLATVAVSAGVIGTVNQAAYKTPGDLYDLVVDSNAKLDAWARATLGQFKRVLIKSGTWTAPNLGPTAGVLINLDNTGTVYVFGEKGSSIVYSGSYAGTLYGLYHASLPSSIDTERFENVKVALTNTSTNNAFAFYQCTNLIGCTGTSTVAATGEAHGFDTCSFLVDCVGTGNTTSAVGIGFNSCDHLTNCVGTGIAGSVGSGYGFGTCNRLTNCIGNGSGGSAAGNGNGFYNCVGVVLCRGKGLAPGGMGYGFIGCTKMQQNAPNGASKTATYNTSYADAGAGNACADTAAGGYNS